MHFSKILHGKHLIEPDLGNMGKRVLGGTFKGLLFKLSTVVHHNILLNRLGLGINSEFLCH